MLREERTVYEWVSVSSQHYKIEKLGGLEIPQDILTNNICKKLYSKRKKTQAYNKNLRLPAWTLSHMRWTSSSEYELKRYTLGILVSGGAKAPEESFMLHL